MPDSHTFDFEIVIYSAILGLLVKDNDLGGVLVEAEQEEGLFFAQLEVVKCFDAIGVYFNAGRHCLYYYVYYFKFF